jgi:hypothetical protein
MKPVILKTLIVGFFVISGLGCKKSDSTTTPPKSKTVLLTQSIWKVQSVSVDLNKDGIGDADASSYFQSCDLDNTYNFKTDGTGIMDEGATICDSSNPQTRAFIWSFKNNETILSGDFISSNGDATLISINDTNLVISYDYQSTPSTTYRIIATLKH